MIKKMIIVGLTLILSINSSSADQIQIKNADNVTNSNLEIFQLDNSIRDRIILRNADTVWNSGLEIPGNLKTAQTSSFTPTPTYIPKDTASTQNPSQSPIVTQKSAPGFEVLSGIFGLLLIVLIRNSRQVAKMGQSKYQWHHASERRKIK